MPEKAPRSHAPQRVSAPVASPTRAPLPAVAPAPIADVLGNQATLHALAIRTGTSIGGPDDPEEREADKLAEHLAGPPGSGARVASPASRLVSNTNGSDRLFDAGAPLPPAMHRKFASRLGTDLSHLRLHRGPAAAAAARAVGAQAFAHGNDIALGAAAPLPDSAAGEHLLAHEVAHVALGHRGLRRQVLPGAQGERRDVAAEAATSTPVARWSALPRAPEPTVGLPNRGGSAPYTIVDPQTASQRGIQYGGLDTVLNMPSSFHPVVLVVEPEAGLPRGIGFDYLMPTAEGPYTGYVESEPTSAGVGRALLCDRMLRALRAGIQTMELEVSGDPRPMRGRPPGSEPTAVEAFHAEIYRALGRPGRPQVNEKYQLTASDMIELAYQMGRPDDSGRAALELDDLGLLARARRGDATALAALRARPSAQAAPAVGTPFMRQIASPETPELFALHQHGPGMAAGRAGLSGAGFGVVTALGSDLLLVGTGLEEGGWSGFAERMPRTIALGALGGGVSGVTQQMLVAGTSSSLLARNIAPGWLTGAALTGSRMAAGAAGAGAVELVVIYGLERERPHSVREAAGRVGRSVAIGAISTGVGSVAAAGAVSLAGTLLGSAEAGAAVGSVAPGPGNAIGAVVGVLVGLIVFIALDSAVPRVEPTAAEQ